MEDSESDAHSVAARDHRLIKAVALCADKADQVSWAFDCVRGLWYGKTGNALAEREILALAARVQVDNTAGIIPSTEEDLKLAYDTVKILWMDTNKLLETL